MNYDMLKKLFLSETKILSNTEECLLLNSISQGIFERENNTLIDEIQLKCNQDWSDLSRQVVGGETI